MFKESSKLQETLPEETQNEQGELWAQGHP